MSTKKGDKEDPFGVFNFTSPSMRRRDGDESSSDGKFKHFHLIFVKVVRCIQTTLEALCS